MTHDPMCPDYTSAHANVCSGENCDDCQCDLIDKVRADTVEQIWLASKARQAAKRGES